VLDRLLGVVELKVFEEEEPDTPGACLLEKLPLHLIQIRSLLVKTERVVNQPEDYFLVNIFSAELEMRGYQPFQGDVWRLLIRHDVLYAFCLRFKDVEIYIILVFAAIES